MLTQDVRQRSEAPVLWVQHCMPGSPGLNNSLIEYAAEMGLEHNLGLTCDPVGGYVQIPCIERNGYAALRAIDCAIYAKNLGYVRKNKVSFDAVVNVMKTPVTI